MIFEPYLDELNVISHIHKFNEEEFTIIRLTNTMIEKNNIDANVLFRDLLKNTGLVDYDQLQNGGNNGIKLTAKMLLGNTIESVPMNFYKVAGTRSDPRFSIYGIKNMSMLGKITVGDLLYITVAKSEEFMHVVILNTTRNVPNDDVLLGTFGIGGVEDSASRLIPAVKAIARAGFHPNSKGEGKFSPKDVGDTLEFLLGIKTNNSQDADFEGKIEIKSKLGKTLDTLFTLRPQFEGTKVAINEPIDRSRVSAFTRLYGYDSSEHENYKSLYITIGTKIAPQNRVGFFLEINEENRTVELRKWTDDGIKTELTAYWTFESLKKELHMKHPATLWVKAKTRVVDEVVEFKYFEAELTREPQFSIFLSLIESGGITYDWRGYTTPAGKYTGKNHGNAWRIKNKYRPLLFGSVEQIDLL